jgi:AraC-like DNA-binding protein
MKLQIKNMVCDRCKMVILNILEEFELSPVSLQLGEVDLGDVSIDAAQVKQFQDRIEQFGFELINDRKSKLIENIRKHVIALVQEEAAEKVKLSVYLSDRLHHDYNYLSNLFSSVEGVTIEHYLITQKIEKTKELLVYDELTLTEIAFRLGYSSVSHLSRQFTKVTGLTPSRFKLITGNNQRLPIDKV